MAKDQRRILILNRQTEFYSVSVTWLELVRDGLWWRFLYIFEGPSIIVIWVVTLETEGGPDRSGQWELLLVNKDNTQTQAVLVAIVHNDDHGPIHDRPHPGSRPAGPVSAIPLIQHNCNDPLVFHSTLSQVAAQAIYLRNKSSPPFLTFSNYVV